MSGGLGSWLLYLEQLPPTYLGEATFEPPDVAFDAEASEVFASSSTFTVGTPQWASGGEETFLSASLYRVRFAFNVSTQQRFFGSASYVVPRIVFIGVLVKSEPTGVAIIYAYGSPYLSLDVSPTIATMLDVRIAPSTRIDHGSVSRAIIGLSQEPTSIVHLHAGPTTTIEVEREQGIMSRNIGDAETILFRFLVFDAVTEERVLTDPDVVRVHVVRPDGTSYMVQYEVDDVTVIDRVSAGKFWVKVPFAMKGRYHVLFQGTYPAEGTEPIDLMVEDFRVPFPTFTP